MVDGLRWCCHFGWEYPYSENIQNSLTTASTGLSSHIIRLHYTNDKTVALHIYIDYRIIMGVERDGYAVEVRTME